MTMTVISTMKSQDLFKSGIMTWLRCNNFKEIKHPESMRKFHTIIKLVSSNQLT